jgi:hypothetical protein
MPKDNDKIGLINNLDDLQPGDILLFLPSEDEPIANQAISRTVR